ncbi:MAG: hypothetical protein U0R19_11430 [Bryobacteraceae bacterium]
MRAFSCFVVSAAVHVIAIAVALAVAQYTQDIHYRMRTASVEKVAEAEQALPQAYALLDSTPCHKLLLTTGAVSRVVTLWPIEFASGLLPEVADASQAVSQGGMTLVAVAPLLEHRIFLTPAFFRHRRFWAPVLAHEILHAVYGWDDQKLKQLLCPADTTEATHCITIEIHKGCPTILDTSNPEPTERLAPETT